MGEPLTTVGIGAIAAYLGKDGVEKLLGPTADYLGLGFRDLAKKRVENIGRIFQKAQDKLGKKIEQPGRVPSRVLKTILDEGSFCEDELAVEYFGGVLASSRTEEGRDDRGARIAKILDGLSSYQIRTHYLIYSSVKNLFSSSGLQFGMDGRPKMELFLPFQEYVKAMEFSPVETQQYGQILNHVFFGLDSEALIEPSRFQYGPKESIVKLYGDANDGGIVCQPSALGAELFLWAFGHSVRPLEFIFDAAFNPTVSGISMGVAGAAATQDVTAT